MNHHDADADADAGGAYLRPGSKRTLTISSATDGASATTTATSESRMQQDNMNKETKSKTQKDHSGGTQSSIVSLRASIVRSDSKDSSIKSSTSEQSNELGVDKSGAEYRNKLNKNQQHQHRPSTMQTRKPTEHKHLADKAREDATAQSPTLPRLHVSPKNQTDILLPNVSNGSYAVDSSNTSGYEGTYVGSNAQAPTIAPSTTSPSTVLSKLPTPVANAPKLLLLLPTIAPNIVYNPSSPPQITSSPSIPSTNPTTSLTQSATRSPSIIPTDVYLTTFRPTVTLTANNSLQHPVNISTVSESSKQASKSSYKLSRDSLSALQMSLISLVSFVVVIAIVVVANRNALSNFFLVGESSSDEFSTSSIGDIFGVENGNKVFIQMSDIHEFEQTSSHSMLNESHRH